MTAQYDFEELSNRLFVTSDIRKLRKLREEANKIASQIALRISRNSKTFCRVFKEESPESFRDIDIPLLDGKTKGSLFAVATLAPRLSILDPQQIEIIKTKNGIKIRYEREHVRKVPFWFALPSDIFEVLIPHIETALEQSRPQDAERLREEEKQAVELLREVQLDFLVGEISRTQFLQRSQDLAETIETIRKTLDELEVAPNLDDVRDQRHAEYVRQGVVPATDPFLSSVVRDAMLSASSPREETSEPKDRIRTVWVTNESPFL